MKILQGKPCFFAQMLSTSSVLFNSSTFTGHSGPDSHFPAFQFPSLLSFSFFLLFCLGSLSPGLQLHCTFCSLYFSPFTLSRNSFSHQFLSHCVFRKRAHMNSESICFCSGYVYLICLRSVNTEIILDFSTVAHTHKHIQMKNVLFF